MSVSSCATYGKCKVPFLETATLHNLVIGKISCGAALFTAASLSSCQSCQQGA